MSMVRRSTIPPGREDRSAPWSERTSVRRHQEQPIGIAIERLTPREREVLAALADGLSDKEIAEHLAVSHQTVRTHMANILTKLGVSSRLQALVVAVRHGLVRID